MGPSDDGNPQGPPPPPGSNQRTHHPGDVNPQGPPPPPGCTRHPPPPPPPHAPPNGPTGSTQGGLTIQVMPPLKDLLPRLAQLAVPCVLLPMNLQAGLRGLITQIGATTPPPSSTPPHRIAVTVDPSPLAPPPDPIWIGADRVARRRANPAATLPTPHGATPPSLAPASSTLRLMWIRSGQPMPLTPHSSPLAYAGPPPLRRRRPRPPPQRLHRASPTLASATPVRPRPPSPLLPLSVARHRACTPFAPARPSARPRAPVRPRARPAPTSRSHGAGRPLLPTPAAVSALRHLATSARVAVIVRGLIPLPLRLPSAAADLSANRATLLRPSEPGRAPAPSPAARGALSGWRSSPDPPGARNRPPAKALRPMTYGTHPQNEKKKIEE
nr:lysine-rich arabinogalactan protein 19-like [Aegilops tauschii subsp. strangulata]